MTRHLSAAQNPSPMALLHASQRSLLKASSTHCSAWPQLHSGLARAPQANPGPVRRQTRCYNILNPKQIVPKILDPQTPDKPLSAQGQLTSLAWKVLGWTAQHRSRALALGPHRAQHAALHTCARRHHSSERNSCALSRQRSVEQVSGVVASSVSHNGVSPAVKA